MCMSTSKQRNFSVEEALGKKCTTYSDVKSSQESIAGVPSVRKWPQLDEKASNAKVYEKNYTREIYKGFTEPGHGSQWGAK